MHEKQVDDDEGIEDIDLDTHVPDMDRMLTRTCYLSTLFCGFAIGLVCQVLPSTAEEREAEAIVKTERMRASIFDAVQITDNSFVIHVQNELGKKAIADLRKAFEAEHPDLTVDSIEKEPVYSAHKGVYSRVSGVAYKIQTSKSK